MYNENQHQIPLNYSYYNDADINRLRKDIT
jgi:hypothetical protein